MNWMDGILWVSLGTGTLAACVALYGRYKALPSFLTGPHVCKLEAGGCQVLFRSPNAALLGVPNSLLGVFFYPLLGAGILAGWPMALPLSASTFSFLMTLWLAWILIRDRLECRVCWTGHLCNTLIWIVLLIR
jgi:uncharacterized membrane protein